jgi:hypothetical protein
MSANLPTHRGDLVWDKNLDYFDLYSKENDRFKFRLTGPASDAVLRYIQHNDGNGNQENAPHVHINRYVSQRLFGIPSRFIEVSGEDVNSALNICHILHHRSQIIEADVLYRAWKVPPVMFESLEIGQTIKLNQIISTTMHPTVLSNFLESNGLIMKIKNAYGIPVSGQEAEFLLAPGSKFLVTDVYRADFDDNDGERFENVTVYDVDMIPNTNDLPLADDFKWWHLFM